MYILRVSLACIIIGIEYILMEILGRNWSLAVALPIDILLTSLLVWQVLSETVIPMMGRAGPKEIRWMLVPMGVRVGVVVVCGMYPEELKLAATSSVIGCMFHAAILWWMFELGKSKYSDIRFVCN